MQKYTKKSEKQAPFSPDNEVLAKKHTHTAKRKRPAPEDESKQYLTSNKMFVKALAANPSETTANSGWNLVGNPYQCWYNIHKLNFTAPITVYNASNKTYSAYSIIDDDYAIAPNQAFFVQCPDGVSEISFPTDGRQMTSVIESQSGAKPHGNAQPTAECTLIDLTVSNGTLSDRTRVVINEKATAGYDINNDAAKFMSDDATVPQLYSYDADGTTCAINERPEGDGKVLLGFSAGDGGCFTIGLSRETTARVELVDNEQGVSVDLSSQDYSFTTGAGTYNDRFEHNPASPSEPSDPVLRHRITLTSTEGGTASAGILSVLSGSATTLTARANPGYVFTGWYLDDELYTTLTSFSYTMGDEDVDFEARFEFNPTNPDEPSKPTDKQYALYLMSEVTFPGGRIDCPLWLTSLDPLGDMTFQLTFPAEAVPDWSTLRLGDRAEGYTVSVAETAEEGVWQLTLTDGTMPAGNAMLLTVQADVPETVEPSTSYQVKINQVSVTEIFGFTVTASTRNGRVYVYKLGDTNGDGEVDVLDCLNMVGYLLNGAPDDDSFIEEVSDVNTDGEYDVMDSVGIQEIILGDN